MYITDQIYYKDGIIEKREGMAEYMAFKKSIYKTTHIKPFTSIPVKPTREQKNILVEEAGQLGLEINVSYTWAGDYGLLPKIHGAAKYLSNTGHNYSIPTQPPDINPDVLLPDKTQIQIKKMQSATMVAKRNYAVVTGFRRGVSKNIQDALEPR